MLTNRYFLFIGLVSLLTNHTIKAQSGDPELKDTLLLENVDILGSVPSKYGTGARITSFSQEDLQNFSSTELANMLQSLTTTYVKQQGSNMLSTVSFRGTGASHTSVLWYGVPIGYPMLGQSDFSLLPIYFYDHLALQHGSSSAEYGNGAIGGIVHLANVRPENGIGVQATQEVGSYGIMFSGLTYHLANNNNYVRVQLLRNSATNDFRFVNTTKKGTPIERQQHAGYRQHGLSLSSRVSLSSRSYMWFSGQLIGMNRDIQPTMNSNLLDHQNDLNLRTILGFVKTFSSSNLSIDWAHLDDKINFNSQRTNVHQDIITAGYEWMTYPRITLKTGARQHLIRLAAPFYIKFHESEQRTSLFASAVLNLAPRWDVALNMRQVLVDGYSIPFTPSLGLTYKPLSKPTNEMSLKTLISRGYRLPTLNDRFWQPGGNPDLAPESSWNGEIGVEGRVGKRIRWHYEVTWYQLWVDEWILWLPEGSIWTPRNIKQVNGHGLELDLEMKAALGKGKMSVSTTYALTKSINKTAIDPFDRSVGKQLPYVPLNKGSAALIYSYKSWEVGTTITYTGQRFVTAENESSLDPYLLVALQARKSFVINRFKMEAYMGMDNLFNESYQTIKNKAMPGRIIRIGLTASFVNKPNVSIK